MATRKNIVLYSCIINHRDKPNSILQDKDFRHVLFTDDPKIKAHGWEIHEPKWTCADPTRTARYHKHHAFDFFPDADWAIWLDMTHWCYNSVMPLLETNDYFYVQAHSERNSIKDEAEVCSNLNLDDPILLRSQVNYYLNQGLKDDKLYNTSCIIMKNSDVCKKLSEMWWQEICIWSKRDQISLPYCLWKLNLNPKIISGSDRGKGSFSPYFKMLSHYKPNILNL